MRLKLQKTACRPIVSHIYAECCLHVCTRGHQRHTLKSPEPNTTLPIYTSLIFTRWSCISIKVTVYLRCYVTCCWNIKLSLFWADRVNLRLFMLPFFPNGPFPTFWCKMMRLLQIERRTLREISCRKRGWRFFSLDFRDKQMSHHVSDGLRWEREEYVAHKKRQRFLCCGI